MNRKLIIVIGNPYVFQEYAEYLIEELSNNFEIWIVVNNWRCPDWLHDFLNRKRKDMSIREFLIVRLECNRVGRCRDIKSELSSIIDFEFDLLLSDNFGFTLTSWVSQNLLKHDSIRVSFYGATTRIAAVKMYPDLVIPPRPSRKTLTRALNEWGILRTLVFGVCLITEKFGAQCKLLFWRPIDGLPATTQHWTLLSLTGFDYMIFLTPEESQLYEQIGSGPISLIGQVPGHKSVQFSPDNYLLNLSKNRYLLIAPFYGYPGFSKDQFDLFSLYLKATCIEFNIGHLDIRMHPGKEKITGLDLKRLMTSINISYAFVSNDYPLTHGLGQYSGVIGVVSSALAFCRDIGSGGNVICIDDDRIQSDHPVVPLSESLFRRQSLIFIDKTMSFRFPSSNTSTAYDSVAELLVGL